MPQRETETRELVRNFPSGFMFESSRRSTSRSKSPRGLSELSATDAARRLVVIGIGGKVALRAQLFYLLPIEDCSMSDVKTHPYATYLDIKFPALEKIDVSALVNACKDRWYNQTLCKVNDSVIRLGIMQGEYHWHKHDADDEFFFVLDGHFIIDLEDRSVDLKPREGFVVPKGVVHRTRAPEKAVILMVETAAIVPTGDA